jgi:hypothetical protein
VEIESVCEVQQSSGHQVLRREGDRIILCWDTGTTGLIIRPVPKSPGCVA